MITLVLTMEKDLLLNIISAKITGAQPEENFCRVSKASCITYFMINE
jgi:hypothetical protein